MIQTTTFKRSVLWALAIFMLSAGTTLHAGLLYTQPFDGTGTAFASQNDTNTGGSGNFATMYDNFTLASNSNLTGVQFTGEYFGPPGPGTITAWTLTFYNDAAGIPGAPIASGFFLGNGGETFLGTFGGLTTNTYELDFGAFPVLAGTYWLSVVPDLGFPPQWGWSTATGGDGGAYQCFEGTCAPSPGVDMAFNILGDASVPEPVSMTLVGAGLALLAFGARRRKTAA